VVNLTDLRVGSTGTSDHLCLPRFTRYMQSFIEAACARTCAPDAGGGARREVGKASLLKYRREVYVGAEPTQGLPPSASSQTISPSQPYPQFSRRVLTSFLRIPRPIQSAMRIFHCNLRKLIDNSIGNVPSPRELEAASWSYRPVRVILQSTPDGVILYR